MADALAFVKGRMWTELIILFSSGCDREGAMDLGVYYGLDLPAHDTFVDEVHVRSNLGANYGQRYRWQYHFAIIMMGFNGLGQEISWQKHAGYFTFYSSLPISKAIFVVTRLARGLMTTLPSVIIMAFIGQFVYGVQPHYEWGLSRCSCSLFSVWLALEQGLASGRRIIK